MKRNNCVRLFLTFILSSYIFITAQAQSLSLEEFFNIVKVDHPIAKQANLQIDISKSELQASRGQFDPAFYLTNQGKEFGSKTYYQYSNAELKIPTWYGIDLKAGIDNNGGQFINTELSEGQSSYIGIQASLGKGLLLDKRRAALLQAKQMVSFSQEEKNLMVNQLLYDAGSTYFEWQNQYLQKRLIDSIVVMNQERFLLIKKAALLGDRPMLDTTEALTQLQYFEYLQVENNQHLNNAALQLNNYLWLPNQTPYQLPTNIYPTEGSNTINEAMLMPLEHYFSMLYTHPKLKQANIKTEILNVDKRLKFQNLLPTVNVQFNFLSKGYSFADPQAGLFQHNNKWGVTLGLPLLLREGRAEYKKATLKIESQRWQNTLQLTELQNKVRQYYNDIIQVKQQYLIYQKAVDSYQKLYIGELSRFNNGESSLFLLNSRETKLLEAQQKLTTLKTKVSKSHLSLYYGLSKLDY